jgi:mitochondrial fission protein ELM1
MTFQPIGSMLLNEQSAFASEKSLKLMLLEDKKPGHFHQVAGVARALERLVPVVSTPLKIRQRRAIHVGLLPLLMKLQLSPRLGLWLLYDINIDAIERPDGIVGSGRSTVPAGILLSQHFGVPFVFAGMVSGYDTQHVAMQLVGKRRFAGMPGFAWVPKPTSIDPEVYPVPRPVTSIAAMEGAEFALLIGGDSTDHRFTAEEWQAITALVSTTHERFGVAWRVSTSRRSPVGISDAIAALAYEGTVAEFVDYRSAGPGSATRLYGADVIVVTHDSRSMIAEASAARRPVIALRPQDVTASSPGKAFASNGGFGGLAVLDIASLHADAFATAVVALPPSTAPNAMQVIATAVAPVFGVEVKLTR